MQVHRHYEDRLLLPAAPITIHLAG